MKTKLGWKVVVVRDQELISALGAGFFVNQLRRCYYSTERYTKPHTGCGPLAVFTTKRAAQDFVRNRLRLPLQVCTKIYRCKYVPAKMRALWIYDPVYGYINPSMSMPEGTDFASKVKLLNGKNPTRRSA